MRNKRGLFRILFVLASGIFYAATPYASIAYAEGNSFVLIRDGKSVTHPVSSSAVFGMEIKIGDIIQTNSSTFLELSIHPISASVQIAENTSFRCNADETGTKSSGELYYGRVHAKVAKLTGTSSYRISSPTLVAGIRGTDFGCDVIAVTGSPVLNRVFCFEGSVLIGEASGTTMKTVLIGNNEMVESFASSLSSAAAKPEANLEKKPVSTEVTEFWKGRPFTNGTPGSSVTTKPELESNIIGPVADINAEGKLERNKRIPNMSAILLVGLGSMTCIAAGVYSAQVPDSSTVTIPAQSAGIVMIGSGIVLALISSLAD